MPLTAGTRLGPYEILAAIGAGGMGEVYRATDTRLNRTVAIKILPSHTNENPETRAAMRVRFEREAQAISSLSHPHIGRFLLFNTAMGRDVWTLPLAQGMPGAGKPVGLLEGPYSQNQAQVSPNGRWVAYRSQESGRYEIFVQSLPIGKGKWQVSSAGGAGPRWRGDGKEMFFEIENRLMAVDVKTDGASFEAGIPKLLFEAPFSGLPRNNYVVTRDGQRFLIVAADQALAPPINVVLNFTVQPK